MSPEEICHVIWVVLEFVIIVVFHTKGHKEILFFEINSLFLCIKLTIISMSGYIWIVSSDNLLCLDRCEHGNDSKQEERANDSSYSVDALSAFKIESLGWCSK